MKTRLRIIILCILFICGGLLSAQNDKDKVEALRVSFITKKVELSVAESEKFWPVYNEYNDKVKAIRRNLRQSYAKKSVDLTEREAEELYMLEIQSKQAEADLFKQYSEKIKSIIGVKKLARLHVAEEEFKQAIKDIWTKKSD